VTLNQAVPPGGTISSPCSASPSLVAPGGMSGAPDWPAALTIVTVPSPPPLLRDRAQPARREDGLDLPEGRRRAGEVDHLNAELELAAMLHRARSRGLVYHGPGEPSDAQAGGVSPGAPGQRRRIRRRGRGRHVRRSGISGYRPRGPAGPRKPPVAECVPGDQPDDQRGNAKDRRTARRPPVEGGKPPGAPDPSRHPQRPAVVLYDVVLAGPVHPHATTVAFSAACQQPPSAPEPRKQNKACPSSPSSDGSVSPGWLVSPSR
jgi:hypothetical protein